MPMIYYIYFIKAKTSACIKIGKAIDPMKRLRGLAMFSPERLELLGVLAEGQHTEKSIHTKFATSRDHGEWFKVTPDLLAFIAENTTAPVKPEKKVVLPCGTLLRTPGALGNLIKGYRITRGWKQVDLAEAAGVSRQWVCEVEKGKPRAEIGLIFSLLNTLDIPIGVVSS